MIDVKKYEDMGYTREEINEAIKEVQESSSVQQLNQAYNQQKQQRNPMSLASNTIIGANGNEENLIKWQLELDSILERIEHILRGDKPEFVNGSLIYSKPTQDAEKIFNDFGVAEIMRILTMYINRNTILSNYDEDTILYKVYDFGVEVSDLIFLKYEAMGLDTLEKRKRYPMIVRELVDVTHSAYLRALNGGERETLRTARTVNQNEGLQPMGFPQQPMRERSILNPMRYFSGRYK